MGIVIGAALVINFFVVLGGFALVTVAIVFNLSRHTDRRQLTMTAVIACAIAAVLAWFFLEQLVASLPAKGIYILTSSFTITWRPLMRSIGIAAFVTGLTASVCYRFKPALIGLSMIALSLSVSGLLQAIVGLFFSKEFYAAHSVHLYY